jgi:hypothetical protein
MAGSRMTAVHKTLLSQVKDMAENHPERKIGIVTFTDYVDIIGDGTAGKIHLSGQQMHDYDTILK